MKKLMIKTALTIVAVLVGELASAQGPGDFEDPADPDPTDAPIGDHLWVLALLNLAWVFFKMRSRMRAGLVKD
ncbi:MAG TPA: hypothetical protein VFR70_09180 [Flavobacterium sp.]|nr:hypothetical protein [Flavobacterium sp.]